MYIDMFQKCVPKMSFPKSTLQNFMQVYCMQQVVRKEKNSIFCYQNPRKSTFNTSKHIRKQSAKTKKHPQVSFFSFKKI